MYRAEVSVVIPCFRCKSTIRRAMASIEAQTICPAEIILVDDCSRDGTLELLYEIQGKHSEGWVKVIALEENKGPGEARNAGWEVSAQPYVAFLDADDTWHPQKIELQYQWMKENPQVALSGHSMMQAKERGRQKEHCQSFLGSDSFTVLKPRHILWSNCYATSSVMVKRDLPYRFAPGKFYSEDYLLWLTIACSGYKFARSNLPLSFMHKAVFGESGLSSQLWVMEKGELDTYHRIWCSGEVSTLHYFALQAWSFIRYLRRLAIIWRRQ